MSEFNVEHYKCSCYSPEHTLEYNLYIDHEYANGELYTNIFLCNKVWYKRIYIAIKYIFGYKSRYGHFDCFSFQPEDRNKFYNLAKKFKQFHDNKNDTI